MLTSLLVAGIGASLLVPTVAMAKTKVKVPANVLAAQKALVPYLNPNPVISLPPLSSTPPTGKNINFITCPVTICLSVQQGVQAAAAKLGWNVNVINGGLSVASWISAMDQATQTPADAVLGIALLPNSAIQSDLTTLASKNIPWIADVSASPVGQNDMLANEGSADSLAISGKIMADWIIADSNAKANTAFFWDPALSVLSGVKQTFTTEMNRLCPKCSVNIQTTSFSSGIGTTDPGQIVSYVQSHPAVKYLVMTNGDAMVGVTQALAAAGLSGKVKILTRSADVINLKDMAKGTEAMGVTSEGPEAGWRMVDAAARYFVGDSLACCTAPTGTYHILTKKTLPHNLSVPWTVPHYQSYFLKAWHVQ